MLYYVGFIIFPFLHIVTIIYIQYIFNKCHKHFKEYFSNNTVIPPWMYSAQTEPCVLPIKNLNLFIWYLVHYIQFKDLPTTLKSIRVNRRIIVLACLNACSSIKQGQMQRLKYSHFNRYNKRMLQQS